MLRLSRLWCHGLATRSQSVLATLLRIRQQYHRPLHRREPPAQVVLPLHDYALSMEQERQQLLMEAMKLLQKDVRGGDVLSDVDATSALFCIEVGKLLSVAAAFGASTTTPRVAEALEWVRLNKKHLVSTRQLMSICTPLLGLKDGNSAGRQFVLGELCSPLLSALEAPLYATASSDSELKQQRNAVVSVFSLIWRLVEGRGSSSGTYEGKRDDDSGEGDDERVEDPPLVDVAFLCTMTQLFSRAVDALLLVGQLSSPLEVGESVHILQAYQRCEECMCNDIKDMENLHASLMRVQPMIDVALDPSTTATVKRPAEICHLLTVASRLKQPQHMVQIARSALALLPSTLASATTKNICVATQMLVRICAKAPEVAEASTLQRVVDAARPKLFLLSEAHPGTLRHIECSILIASLSRLDLVLAEDLINLLCSSFAAHMELVKPIQLIPFLQGLVRYNEKTLGFSSGAETVPIWENPGLPALLPCIEQSSDCVMTWASTGMLTSLEAAQLLLLYSQLRCPRAVAIYTALEPILVETVHRISRTKATYCDADDDGDNNNNKSDDGDGDIISSEIKQERGLGNSIVQDEKKGVVTTVSILSVLMDALNVFRKEAPLVVLEEETSLRRAGELHARLRRDAIRGIALIQKPKTLVMLLQLLVPGAVTDMGVELSSDLQEKDEEARNKGMDMDEDNGYNKYRGGCDGGIASATKKTISSSPSSFLNVAAQQTYRLSSVANAYEVGALAKFMGVLRSKSLIGEAVTFKAFEGLLQRSEDVKLTFQDALSLLEGMRRAGVTSVSSVLLHYISSLMQLTPDKTTVMLRRLLPILKVAVVESHDMKALAKLTEVAMTNAYSRFGGEMASLPPLRDTALLAHLLGQLYGCTSDAMMREACADAENEGENIAALDALGMPDDVKKNLDAITNKAFMALGDAACSFLQQHSGCSGDGGIEQHISPKELVMLVQSFEKVEVGHHALLYEVLPLVRDMSNSIEPLELSLLLNAFARLGVWNGRILNAVAHNVSEQMRTCNLKQCQYILRAVQSSRFLPSSAFLLTSEHQTYVEKDWYSAVSRSSSAVGDPLVNLVTCVVERMNALVETPESVTAVLESHSLEDFVGLARVLSFFEHPPQPAFDTYFALGVKKLLITASNPSVNEAPGEKRRRLMAAVSLASCISKVRRYDRQCASARTIVSALAHGAMKVLIWTSELRLIPEDKVAELYYLRCAFAMLYGVAFSPEEASPMLQVISEKLHMESMLQNPRSVSRVLLRLTGFSCQNMGDPHMVRHTVLDFTWRLLERIRGVAEKEDGDGKRATVSILGGPITAVAFVEALCAACLIAPCPTQQVKGGVLLMHLTQHLLSVDAATEDGKSNLSVAEGCAILVAIAMMTETQQLSKDILTQLSHVQHHILVNEGQVSVHDAVNMLIAASLCRDARIVSTETIQCASRVLVSQLGKTDRTGLWLLPELYRLVMVGDSCFLRWSMECSSSKNNGVLEVFDRIPPALLRALRSSRGNVAPTLSLQCRANVVERYRRWVASAVVQEGNVELSHNLTELLRDETS